ncbi:short chain dehydrogenase reductase [Pseudomassariella vexata]|uniref:Short chain dehydrogenase reductase n=1 Tax=Pseudomassariella vexata TaxID=1141098 RepID=A0A1Y2E8E5_9PEZI|nr:short chain dehydrogenase reductase [Pseudomassariella vexata]ORY67819.1 short chain dehydrogenase reductase [Pseudomassariella vexata]
MSFYDVKGKFAIVTGAGSGINHVLTKMLLEAGCSVIMADLCLRPEAEATAKQYFHPTTEKSAPSAVFQKTDMSNWSEISSLWETALETFGRVDIVVNGAGIYEPPASSFWNPPGTPLSEDTIDAQVGQYKTFAVNTTGPIRLAQIAINYWLNNRSVQGNLMWIASLAGYVHSVHAPMYFASKSAIISMVKSFAPLRKRLGIKNACICPGLVNTPIFHPDYCKDQMGPDYLALSPEQCAQVIYDVLTKAQYGDGNIIEAMLVGTKDNPSVNVREVPLEALYPTVGPANQENYLLAAENLVKQLEARGR